MALVFLCQILGSKTWVQRIIHLRCEDVKTCKSGRIRFLCRFKLVLQRLRILALALYKNNLQTLRHQTFRIVLLLLLARLQGRKIVLYSLVGMCGNPVHDVNS